MFKLDCQRALSLFTKSYNKITRTTAIIIIINIIIISSSSSSKFLAQDNDFPAF